MSQNTNEDLDRIPLEIIQPWLDQLRSARADPEREAATGHYFEHILPLVIDRLASQSSHERLTREGYHTLVSLMGFSPETTVICAAIVRPKRLIVVYGHADDENEKKKAEFSYNTAVEYLKKNGILQPAQIHHRTIDPLDPLDIYDVIRGEIANASTIDDNKTALVDITGGKKVMSATAGQAAWETRLPLCYIDGKFDPLLRRPWPGTERVIKLLNPSKQEQIMMRRDAFEYYKRRNYPLAVESFDQCRANLEDNRLDELATLLCRAYNRWTDLDLPRLRKELDLIYAKLNENRILRLFRDQGQTQETWFEHLETLEQVAAAEPLAMVASYQALSELYSTEAFQRFDFAALLLYRAMEALVEHGLQLKTKNQLEPKHPDWTLLGDPAELQKEYKALSKEVDGSREQERELPNKISFINGLAILCIVDHVEREADMRRSDFIHMMKRVAEKRNESVLAHGKKTLNEADYSEMAQHTEKLAHWVLREHYPDLTRKRNGLTPLDLNSLHNPSTV